MIDRHLEQCPSGAGAEEDSTSLLQSVYGPDKLDLQDVYGNIPELMSAAVDTVGYPVVMGLVVTTGVVEEQEEEEEEGIRRIKEEISM